MGRSAADTPTSPEFLRVSDAERDQAIDELKREFVDGRLSHDTFMLRMHAALGARNSGQLAGLFKDLPEGRSRLLRPVAMARRLGRSTRAAVADGMAAIAEPFRGAATELDPERYLPMRARPTPAMPPAPIPVQSGPPAPLVFPRGGGTSFTIGRQQDCDFYIADMTVSRMHARLVKEPGGWTLIDLGSTNGTRINGWRVRATGAPVRAGDQVRFGSADFFVQSDERAEDDSDPDSTTTNPQPPCS
jgi:hypothetical protein